MGEAVDKQSLEESLHVVERVTHTGKAETEQKENVWPALNICKQWLKQVLFTIQKI